MTSWNNKTSHSCLNDAYTMIVPTYNRPSYFARLVAYLVASGAEFPIIVLDSSDVDVQVTIGKIIESSQLRIQHERYSPDEDVNVKIMKGIMRVETEYVSLCADDDFVIIPTIAKIVNFPSDNDEYLCAQGLYFSFQQVDSDHVVLEEVTFATPSLDQNHPLARLAEYVRRYQPLFYGVHRTEWWRETFMKTYLLRGYMFEEVAPACLTAIAGKVARLHLFYYGQNRETDVAEPDNPKIVTNHPATWYKNDRLGMLRSYVRYRSLLLDALQQTGCFGVEERVVKNIVNQMHGGYLAESLRQYCYENLDRALESVTDGDIDEAFFMASIEATIGSDEGRRITFHIGEPMMQCLRPQLSMPAPAPAEMMRDAIKEMAPYWIGFAECKN